MKKIKNTYLLHAIAWVGLYLFWVMVFQKRAFTLSRTATVEFCYLLFVVANYYYNVYFIIPKCLYKQSYIVYGILFSLGIVVTALLRVPLAVYLNAHYFLVGKPQPTPSAVFVASFVNIFIWSLCLVAARVIYDRYHFHLYTEEVKKEKAKAELDLLNAQLNPHFLFNSLHSIYGHIDKHNTGARNMLLSFSDMLRYQLYDCNTNTIDIEKELRYISNYISLQKARKEDSLTVNLAIDGRASGFTIAPLLFICFVENAFKYVDSNEQSKIDISFCKEGPILKFRCYNTREEHCQPDIQHKGIGIENARRRLALHYGGKHELEISDTTTHYEVNLKIELHEAEMHNSRR